MNIFERRPEMAIPFADNFDCKCLITLFVNAFPANGKTSFPQRFVFQVEVIMLIEWGVLTRKQNHELKELLGIYQ